MKQIILFIYICTFFLIANATCSNGQVEAIITKINSKWCKEESVKIYLGILTTTTPIFTRGWTDADRDQTTEDTICILPDTTYIVELIDSYKDGWDSAASLSITVDRISVLNGVKLKRGGSSTTFIFPFYYLIAYGSPIKYSNIPQIGNEWTSESFSDSTWTEYTAGNFPSISSVTRYYRVSVSFELNNLYGLNISIKAKDGYILYANGVEQYRYGLPDISDANTVATITGTSYVERMITIRTDTFLTENSVTIAVELHGVSVDDSAEDGFDLSINGYTGESGAINHAYISPTNTQCVPDSSSSDSDCSKAFDNLLDTYLLFKGQTGVDTILYNGAVKLNGYQITCISGTDACPKDWILYGTIDNGDTWFYLDSQTSQTFSTSNSIHNYITRSNSLAINGLKLEITANNGGSSTQLNELKPLLVNYPTLSSGIQYENEVTTFNGETYVSMSMTVVSSGFNNFSITPALPTGLTFDPKTGNISGTPTVGVNQEYIVSANIGNSDSITSRTITLNIFDYSQPTFANLKFVKYDKKEAENEKFIVKDQNGVIILNKSGTTNVDKSQTYSQCHEAGIYEVTLISETHNGWDTGSYLDVFLINRNINTEYRIERFYLLEGSTSTFRFNTKLDIAPKSDWKYLDSDTINSEWYFANFEDTAWATMDYMTLPQATQEVVLFRKTITDITRSDYKGIELQIYSRDGTVVYANGNEMYRINLADGDITMTTTATAPSYYAWRKVTLPISVLGTTDTLTLAIAQVSTETPPYTLSFDCTLRFIPSNDIIQTYTGTQSADGNAFEDMFDMNIDNQYISDYHNGQTEHWVQILFKNQVAIFANKYCIVTSYESQYDISDWKIYGTIDGSTWNQLSSETNISWNSPYQRRCFYIPNLTKPQLGYRFAPTKNVHVSFFNYYQAAEMEFYFEDIVIPPLTMTPSRIIAYKGASVPVLVPNSDYYHDFTISPALPSPLVLDKFNGSIKNIPSALQDATEYTITATDILGGISSTTITLTVIACASPNTILTLQVKFTDGNYCARSTSWIIKTPSNTILDSRRYSHDSSTETFSYCVVAGTYTFSFSSTKSVWENGMYYIKNGSGTTLQSGSFDQEVYPIIVAVTIGKLLEEGKNNWKYLQDGTQPDSSWTTADFSDETWGTALSSQIPVPTTTTQYYRTTFVLDSIDLTNIAGFEFAASSYAGLIFYMNGQEIMRFNMPSGDVTKDILATKGSDSYVYYKTSFPISSNYVVVGTNVVAVEIHKFDTLPTKNTFDAYIQFVSNDSYRIMDGVPSSDIETTGSEGFANVFDGNKNTYTYSGPRCVGGYYTWTYNNGRKEFINKLSVTNSNSCYNRNPSGWILEGSNDNGVTWNILFGIHDQLFTTASQTIENAFYSNIPYNSYRYTATQCNNVDSNSCSAGLELSEISLHSDTISMSCQADGIWGAASEGGYSYQSCSSGYIGYRRRVCIDGVLGEEEEYCAVKPPMSLKYSEVSYTMIRGIEILPIIPEADVDAIELIFTSKPALPGGLILDSTTGIISGTPISYSDSKQYTITATNGGGSVSTTLTIIIKKSCLQDNDWPTTAAGETATYECPESSDSKTRYCDDNGIWKYVEGACPGISCSPDNDWPLTNMDDSVSIQCPDNENYEGELVRTCMNNNNEPEWSIITDNCILIKPTITYSQTTITGYTHQLFPIINVSTTGLFDTISIEPELPSGLIFDPSNGRIYGTPIIVRETTEYTVTIENTAGKNTVVLTITIELSKCPQDNEWEVTNADEIASHLCSGSLVGSITRQCSSNGEWEEPIDSCVGCFGVYYKSGNECIVCDHGIVSGDAEGNTNCESCDITTHYIQNNECIPKNTCEAGSFDSIDWHDTLSGYYDIVDCEDNDNIGFYSRQCDYNSYALGWSDSVDKSSCKSKSITSGGALVYVQLSINGLASYQYNKDIDLYVTRAFIVENQYSIYDVDISVPNSYTEDSYTMSTVYAFLYTSSSMSSSVKQNNEQNTDHLLETLYKYDSKIFNNQLSANTPTVNAYYSISTCLDPTSQTQIPIGSTTPNQCDKDIDGYMEYECVQYHLETSIKENGYVKCHPSEPTILPTVSPSTTPTETPTTTPTETPTSTPINQYIKFELLLAGIESKNIQCSTKVGLYRAILASTHSVLYYFDITHFEDVSYNDGIAVKVYITFRTNDDLLSETMSDLQSSLHQSELFSSNLIQYANLYVNNIQVLTNEIVDPSVQGRRRLRG